jgi:CSLREA domain-containing protein
MWASFLPGDGPSPPEGQTAMTGSVLRRAAIALLVGGACVVAAAPRASYATATTFVVNSADDNDDTVCDASHCSLREAINAANANAGTDTITFNIPPGGPVTITPNASGLGFLPTISEPVTIDGTTQPGWAGTPIVTIDGALAATSPRGGLELAYADTTVSSTFLGLVLTRWQYAAINTFTQSWITVDGSYVGVDASGNVAAGNGTGVCVCGSFAYASIGGALGNVISGNSDGVAFKMQSAGTVIHSRIGTNAGGTAAIPNGTGIRVVDSFAHIGGPGPTDGDLISGNGSAVYVERRCFTGCIYATIDAEYNYIGTDVTGSVALPNGGGINIFAGSASGALGSSSGISHNVISGNTGPAISIGSSGAASISDNYIGTDRTGMFAVPNGSGIGAVGYVSPTYIARNVISGNHGDAVRIYGPAHVYDNTIGLNAARSAPLPNEGYGVYGDVIGGGGVNEIHVGDEPEQPGNVIAYNKLAGVSIRGDSTEFVRGNSIYRNGGLTYGGPGIEVRGAQVPAPPDIVTVGATVSGVSCPNCTVEVFSDDGGQGRIFDGAVVADGAGAWSLGGGPFPGPCITATATDPAHGTSSFSAAPQPPSSANNDRDFYDLHAYGKTFDDATRPMSDGYPDACDYDDDNDNLPSDDETQLGPSGASHARCASATANTDPLKEDTDGDHFLDGAECALGTDPASATSKPALTACGATGDADGDGVSNQVEVCRYNTNPNAANSDEDPCADGREAASVNDDYAVTAADLGLIASAFGPEGGMKYVLPFDVSRDGSITAADLGMAAMVFGPC